MGKCSEVVIGRTTNPSTTFTAVTPGSGDSLAVRAFSGGGAWLEGLWAQQATAGAVRIRSPKMHDSTQGLRVQIPAAQIRNALSPLASTRLYSTDTLVVEQTGGAAEVDAVAWAVYYEDMAGADANLATYDQISSRIVDVTSIEVAVTGPTTSGDWSAGNALNSTFDQLKADNRYAVLGYVCDTESLAVAIQGPDTSNYRLGGPGCKEPLETRDLFARLSRETNRPHIPIISSNNRGGTSVLVAKVGTGGTVTVDLIVAQLA